MARSLNFECARCKMALAILFANQAQRQMRRERVFRDRSRPLDCLHDVELFERYRFRRDDLIYIIGLLEERLTPTTKRSHAISPELKILSAIR